MDDSISKDPKLVEEARRVAAEATNPKPPYDPKALAREEWERVIDKRYEVKSFETVWDEFNGLTDRMHKSLKTELKGLLSESEFRQLAASLFMHVNSANLTAAALRAEERSNVTQQAVMYALKDKYGDSDNAAYMPDLQRGLLHKDILEKNACALHPNGCPPNGTEVLTGTDALSALLNILGRARKA